MESEKSQAKEGKNGNNYYAVLSGVCASSASFFGKLAGNVSDKSSFQSIWIVQAICISLMVLCNVFVWSFFVKALHSSGGTLVATVTSAAANYILSFIIGAIVFNEKITSYSVIGLSLILLGLMLLSKSNENQESNKAK